MKTATKFVAVPILTLTLLASGAGFPLSDANAALTAFGPISDPVNDGFPAWFSDENGLQLKLCLDQNPAGLCLLTPGFDPATPPVTPIGTVASGNFPDESFYWHASADLSPANVRLAGANQDIKILWFAALEQAFLSGIVPGGQSIFLRSQVDIGGLVPGETYNFTTPYGPMSVVADETGGGRTRFEDIVGCNVGFACNFAPILPATQTNVGAFLQWDGTLPAPPAGFIGDPNILHTVSGGQGGVNTITVNGLSVGGVGVNTRNTDLFSVSGQLFAPTVKEVVPVTARTATDANQYTFNVNDAGTIAVGGDCTTTATNAIAGNNTITLNTVSTPDPATGFAAHSNCTLTVTNAALNVSNVLAITPFAVDTRPSATVFRFFSVPKQGHFFTTSVAEKDGIIANDPSWTFEGTAFNAFGDSTVGTSPVYRFFSEKKQHHFFTISEAEKNNIIANDPSWTFEGIAYGANATQQVGTMPLFRFWSEQKQGHFFTTSVAEKDIIIANDPSWAFEGVAYYVPIN